MKYPVNVAPHMTCVDASIQQSFSFDFYGEILSGLECRLYDAITSEYIGLWYWYGRNTIASIVEDENGSIANMERCECNFGQINTPSYGLENNRKYKYTITTAQEKINQFVFRGSIVSPSDTRNDRFLVTTNSLLHKPRSYSNSIMTFGFYLAVDIGNERREVIDYYANDDTTSWLIVDSPFTQTLESGTQYRVYSNYVTSPEYYFETKRNPEISIVNLDESYLINGGNAWYCSFNQEVGQLIKSYSWTIEDYDNYKEYALGTVARPTSAYQYTSKYTNESTNIIVGTNKLYLINDFNSVEEKILTDEDRVYLRVFWSDVFDSEVLANAKDNIIYVYGSSEHTLDNNPIKLTYSDFKQYFDSDSQALVCYVTGFTTGGDTKQSITVRYLNTLGTLLGECTLSSSNIQKGGCYDFKLDNSQATTNTMCVIKIADIPQSTIDKNLVINVQLERYTSFIDERVYMVGAGQNLTISWQIKEMISINDDSSYSSGFIYSAKTIYIDTNLGDIIGKKLMVTDLGVASVARTILNYDNDTGLVVLNTGYSSYPSEGATYTIYDNDTVILDESETFYKTNTFYRNDCLSIDKRLRGSITIRTEDDSVFYADKIIDFPTSVKDSDGNPLDILMYLNPSGNIVLDEDVTEKDSKILTAYNNDTAMFSIMWRFKSGYVTNTQQVSIYREEEERDSIDLVYNANVNENYNTVLSYIDYCVANNVKYRYIIVLQVQATGDTVDNITYRYYKYTTDWYSNTSNSWTISGITKTSKYKCNKPIYNIGDTWSLYAQVNSGDIVQNISTNVYASYSTYPKVGRLGNNYISGSLTAMLGVIDCQGMDFVDDIQRVSAWRKFITAYDTYILRSEKGDIWQVSISDNPTTNYDEENELFTTISFSYTQVGDIHDIYVQKE